MAKNTLVVAGCDIGYGNAKAAVYDGGTGRSREIALPAGAAVATALPKIDATKWDLKGGEDVLIDGVAWVAGVEQQHIQRGARQTHAQYPTTDEYYALFLACLARLGQPRIDILVTGLPVGQHFGPDGDQLRAHLRSKLAGRKHVNANTMVEVGRVVCIAQPLGTFMGMASLPDYQALATRDDIRVLCVDVGFGTVDWVLMSGRSVMDQSSGSSTMATSIILSNTARALSSELGRAVTVDQLDSALRHSRHTIPTSLTSEHNFQSTLIREATAVARSVVSEILSSVRTTGPVDHVILTGGGSSLYEPAIRAAFPGSDAVITADNVVLANALGYREVARQLAERSARVAA